MAVKRKGEDEEDDVTAIPWDGQYGPETPKETAEGDGPPPPASSSSIAGGGGGSGGIHGVVQWEDGAVGGGGGVGGRAGESGDGQHKKPKLHVRAVVTGGGGSG